MIFQDQSVVEIGNRLSSALFAPQYGGRLLRWRINGRDIIYWPDDADWSNPQKIRGGNPLLFPFIARHLVDGQLGWWQDDAGVKREMPVHGFARSLPFSHTVSADGMEISMVLQDNQQTRHFYPYPFRFEARYRLDGNALQVTLAISNLGERPMPYYAGHHFYFSLPHALRETSTLSLPQNQRRSFLQNGDISAPEPGLTCYRLSDPCIQDRFHVLQSQQDVRLSSPAIGREITIGLQVPGSIAWHTVTTWAENPDDDYYCVEPWTGLPNAIHHRLGLRWLQPAQQENATCRIEVGFA